MIKLGKNICSDPVESMSREWLETNGIGGFASGTVSGANSRRYHGLLTVATRPPLGRCLLLSKIEETLIVGGGRYDLSTNRYPNRIYPEGFKYLTGFRLDPFPTWTFEVEGVVLEKKIFLVHGEHSLVCRWSVIQPGPSAELEVRPLLAYRDYHHLRTSASGLSAEFTVGDAVVSIDPLPGFPALHFAHNGTDVSKTGFWYRDFEYAIEQERGFDYRENLFQPFAIRFGLGTPATVIASTRVAQAGEAAAMESAELDRREALVEAAGAADDFTRQLVLAADQFIVSRGEGKTVIAGYPWFSDWGRDTMIALPGLTLSTGRPEIARQILLEFSNHVSEGMIPNRFPDIGDVAEYNTVDATLWYFEAVRAYVEATGDLDFVREHLYEKFAGIIEWHMHGTRYGIRVDTDGLLCAGEKGVQLTWMDAKYGSEVFTPRTGKPVEIQALWYNALKVMAGFAACFGEEDAAQVYEATAAMAKQSFNSLFWNEAEGCLFDVVDNGNRDGAVRPNQIFAAGLRHAILDDPTRVRKVVEKVEKELLTPVGLRSLSPDDPQFRGVYIGSPYRRDSSYHQGPVWGWLIGGFIDAYRKAFPGPEDRVAEVLSGFRAHLLEAGLGQISEIFDGNPPHRPRGCPAQAWSVAEVLRVSLES